MPQADKLPKDRRAVDRAAELERQAAIVEAVRKAKLP